MRPGVAISAPGRSRQSKTTTRNLVTRSRAWWLGVTLLSVWVGGCTARPAVTITTADRTFTENFPQAYGSITPGGDDVVVLAGGLKAGSNPSALRHVLRIRTLWHPVSGAKPSSPAAVNAALHYFVYTGPAAATPAFIHYAGTGFVTIEHHNQTTTVTVRNAKLAPVESYGPLFDPLKTFQLSGEFEVSSDGHKVDATLADLSRVVPTHFASPATAPAPHSPLP